MTSISGVWNAIYLTIAWDSGATPVVLLTKADLCNDIAAKIAETESVAAGVDIVTTSVMEEGGARIAPYLSEGKTLAFVGSSGVGKSTLINALLGEDRLKTNGLRNDGKGRHTTSGDEHGAGRNSRFLAVSQQLPAQIFRPVR